MATTHAARFRGGINPTPLARSAAPITSDAARAAVQADLDATVRRLADARAAREALSARTRRDVPPSDRECALQLALAGLRARLDTYDAAAAAESA